MRIRVNNLFLLSRPIDCEVLTARTSGRPPGISKRSYAGVCSTLENQFPGIGLPEQKSGATIPTESSSAPLSDLYGRRHNYLRISLTERCNLRCQYCMPAKGVTLTPREHLLTREELTRLVRVFAGLGVDKLRLTGGEPTLRSDLADIIQSVKGVAGIRSVAMTSNGLVLTRRLPALHRAGLDALNVSLDSMRAHRYERMSRRPGLSRVLAGVDLALQLGYAPVKINTVLMRGFNEDEICDFVEYTRDRHVEVRFIEFMPFSGNKWDGSMLVPYREALRTAMHTYPALEPAPPRPNDTATLWRVPGYAGSVGFISSMTQHFCSSCNRLRLTADGNLKVCLFGASEVSLRDAMRSGAADPALEKLVRSALRNKKPRHAGETTRGSRTVREPRRSASHGARACRHAEPRPNGEPAHDSHRRVARPVPRVSLSAVRAYCTAAGGGRGGEGDESDAEEGGALTHFDSAGRARMVDVSSKPTTRRVAEAECSVRVSGRVVRLLRDARLPKGDALSVARVAGALGAKRTAELVPLCHALALDAVRVRVALPAGERAAAAGGALVVRCEARVTARTGAEMEALVGAAVAALALYDMCKAVDKRMRITDLRVVRKSGGSSDWAEGAEGEGAEGAEAPRVRDHDRSPLRPDETFVPTNFMHF